VFAYIKEHDRSCLVLSSKNPEVREDMFQQHDWGKYYPDAAEAVPPNMSKQRGKSVVVTCYVDADHAGCKKSPEGLRLASLCLYTGPQ
jgi:hypothetical protein